MVGVSVGWGWAVRWYRAASAELQAAQGCFPLSPRICVRAEASQRGFCASGPSGSQADGAVHVWNIPGSVPGKRALAEGLVFAVRCSEVAQVTFAPSSLTRIGRWSHDRKGAGKCIGRDASVCCSRIGRAAPGFSPQRWVSGDPPASCSRSSHWAGTGGDWLTTLG